MTAQDNISRGIKKRFKQADVFLLLACDTLVYFIALFLVVRFRMDESLADFLRVHAQSAFITLAVTLVSFYVFDLYYVLKDFRRYQQFVNLILAAGAAFMGAALVASWDHHLADRQRMNLVDLYLVFFILSGGVRIIFSMLRTSVFPKRAILLGCSETGQLLFNLLNDESGNIEKFGIQLIGYISESPDDAKDSYPGLQRIGSFSNIQFVTMSRDADLLIYALGERGDSRLNELLMREKLRGVDLISSEALLTSISGKVHYEYLNSSWLIEECLRGNKFAEAKVKRLFDVVVAGIALALFFPVILIASLLILLESPGPALFIQVRIGRFGRPFKIYKLRTMRVISDNSPEIAEGWHERNLNRITFLGNILRKTHIDELPQFWNVLKGDMSVVGPRPEMEMFIRQCETTIPLYRLRLAVRPGLTGWAQIWYTHTSTLEGYKNKFMYDLYYLSNLSLRLDMEIILRTVFMVMGYPKTDNRSEEDE